jgi:EmrB/QacA subfamily drug resistance transporter
MTQPSPRLDSRRGKLTLALLCAVAFLDFVDASIVNVALPSIRDDLDFSVQDLQWVLSGYLLTYGGFLLLGGRAADLLGRRRILTSGTVLFALSSLAGGFAGSAEALVGARLAQGVGAAMMTPAALSILTTTFNSGTDRLTALGAWGAMAGLASAFGVLLGGVITDSFSWRWVLLVNVPLCVMVVIATFALVEDDARDGPIANFDVRGALLVSAGMLLLIFTLVEAPDVGWGETRTIGGLGAALGLLVLFLINEQLHPNPLAPLSIFRIKGLAAADATQVISIAGFYSVFFFITLYMQNVLDYSAIEAGVAYLPVTICVMASSLFCSKLFVRTGTRPIIVVGSLVSAGAVFWLSQIPVDGSYFTDLLPGLMIMALGLGGVFVGVQTAANAGVPPDKSGLAAALVNTSFQLGAALGLAIFSALATSRTNGLLADGMDPASALTSGFERALVACSAFLVGAAIIGLRATNTRGEPVTEPEERVLQGANLQARTLQDE